MNHEEILNSPLLLELIPGAPCLSASVLDESVLTSVVAGQTCTACLSACNAFGAPLKCGGAPLTAAFGSDGASSTLELVIPVRMHPGVAKCPDLSIEAHQSRHVIFCALGCFGKWSGLMHISRSSCKLPHQNPYSRRRSQRSIPCAAGSWHAAEVANVRDGTYAVSFKPEKAGSFHLMLSMEISPKACAQKRIYTGECAAGVAAAEKCAISGMMAQLVAGQPGKLTLSRADGLVESCW